MTLLLTLPPARSTASAAAGPRLVLALLLVGAFTPRLARAEDEFHAFDVSHVGASIELRTEQRSELREQAGGGHFASESLAFSELFGIELGGSVLHPRFLRFDGGARLHLRQEGVETNGEPDRDDRVLTDGRLYVGLLEQHPYRFALSGSVDDQVVDPKFGRSYGLATRRAGASFSYVDGPIPLYVSYDRGWRRGDGERKDIDESREDFLAKAGYAFETLPTEGEVKYAETHSILNFAVGGGDVLRQPIDIRRIEGTNTTYFGARRRSWFNGRAEFEDRSESTSDRLGRIFGTFNWTHTDTLSSRYALSLQRREISGARLDSLDANAALRHRFWLSLTTQPRAWANLQRAPFGSLHRYGGELLEDYTKKLGDWGRISLALAPSAELVRRKPTDETAFVVDEAVTLRGLLDVSLAQRDVDRESIRVTDADGVTIYREDFDYRVTVLGPVTQLARIPTGDISDPETVHVDYRHRNDRTNEILDTQLSSDARLQIGEWLGIHAAYSRKRQQRLSGVLETQLESRDRWLADAEVSYYWLSVAAGFEDEEGTFASFRSLTQTLAVMTPVSARTQLRLSATHRGLVYRDRDDEVSRWLVTAVVRQRIGRRSWLDVLADYNRERWAREERSASNDRDALGVMATYNWLYRSFQLELTGRISRVEERRRTEYTHRFSLRLRRDF